MAIPVSIKHAGKKYDLTLDPAEPPFAFKQSIHQATGVEPAKQKVLVKGGQLKDDGDWSKFGIKPGHQFMVIGTAGELPKPPPKPVVFMEDMTEEQAAQAIASPAGLNNLGNTCYLNSTVQVLRAIPELQSSLTSYRPAARSGFANDGRPGASSLTTSLRDLYQALGKTSDSFPPLMFLDALRRFAPQFAEQSRAGGGYAQQDAEECWTQIVGAVRDALPLNVGQGETETGSKFVDRYMSGEMTTETKCTELADGQDEPTTTTTERWLELKCNISIATNYMMTGIKDALEQPLEKQSPVLGRNAVYQQTSRISRLPAYLTVHMVRFYWRREINKKTKIMRKVKFPFDLDLVDLCSSDLASKIRPVSERLKEVDKDRRDRAKIRGRSAPQKPTAVNGSTPTATAQEPAAAEGAPQMDVDLPDESTARAKEREELWKLVPQELQSDRGGNVTGQYELVGIVTHKGASADGGHYLGWVRTDVASGSQAETDTFVDPDKLEWYRFDDDKVSTVPREKILTLDGGGEDSTAYLLLYRSKPF